MDPYTRQAYLGYLHAVPMFSACTPDELDALVARSQARQVPDGEAIVREGDTGSDFFVIATGKASVERGGKEVDAIGEGGFFGELALFDPAPRNATVVARGPVTVVVLERDQFHEVLAVIPDIRDRLLQGMARRLHLLDARV